MAQLSGFFNSGIDELGEYDREYDAEFFAAYFASFIGNGVFPNPSSGLQVIASSGMSVILQPGQAWINGYWYSNTDNLQLTFSPASGVQKRIDAIVIRWSSGSRTIEAFVKEGTPALSPAKPLVQRDADAFELIVAYGHIDKNVISITQTNLEDARPISTVCGYVHGVVTQIDTTTLGNQLQTFIDEYMSTYKARYQEFLEFIHSLEILCNAAYQGFLDFLRDLRQASQEDRDMFEVYIRTLKSDSDIMYSGFIDWLTTHKSDVISETTDLMNQLKDLIDTEAAGNLQNQINDLKRQTPTAVLGTIKHNFNKYVTCILYKTSWAAGIGGAGVGPAGGGNLIRIQDACQLDGFDTVIVVAPDEFMDCTDIHKISETEYAFVSASSDVKTQSLLLILS